MKHDTSIAFKIYDSRKAIALLILISTIVASSTILIFLPLQLTIAQQQEQRKPTVSSSDPANLPSSSNSLPDVFKKVENSVVQITSTRSNTNQLIIINGIPATGRSTALGSGFVYDNQGHIITNYHVIADADKADVTFTDGNTYSAKVIGKDPDADLSVPANN